MTKTGTNVIVGIASRVDFYCNNNPTGTKAFRTYYEDVMRRDVQKRISDIVPDVTIQ